MVEGFVTQQWPEERTLDGDLNQVSWERKKNMLQSLKESEVDKAMERERKKESDREICIVQSATICTKKYPSVV